MQLNSDLTDTNNKIALGTFSFIQGINPNGTNTRDILFKTPFTDDNYFIALNVRSGGDYWSWVVLGFYDKTKNGFSIRASNNHGSGAIPSGLTVDWIAIHN